MEESQQLAQDLQTLRTKAAELTQAHQQIENKMRIGGMVQIAITLLSALASLLLLRSPTKGLGRISWIISSPLISGALLYRYHALLTSKQEAAEERTKEAILSLKKRRRGEDLLQGLCFQEADLFYPLLPHLEDPPSDQGEVQKLDRAARSAAHITSCAVHKLNWSRSSLIGGASLGALGILLMGGGLWLRMKGVALGGFFSLLSGGQLFLWALCQRQIAKKKRQWERILLNEVPRLLARREEGRRLLNDWPPDLWQNLYKIKGIFVDQGRGAEAFRWLEKALVEPTQLSKLTLESWDPQWCSTLSLSLPSTLKELRILGDATPFLERVSLPPKLKKLSLGEWRDRVVGPNKQARVFASLREVQLGEVDLKIYQLLRSSALLERLELFWKIDQVNPRALCFGEGTPWELLMIPPSLKSLTLPTLPAMPERIPMSWTAKNQLKRLRLRRPTLEALPLIEKLPLLEELILDDGMFLQPESFNWVFKRAYPLTIRIKHSFFYSTLAKDGDLLKKILKHCDFYHGASKKSYKPHELSQLQEELRNYPFREVRIEFG